MTQNETFAILREHIESMAAQRPIRVAINGIEGTGKTVFATKLTEFLVARGRAALHVSIDGFHNQREHRYRQGRDSAKGYYEDSYNEQAFNTDFDNLQIVKNCRGQ